MNKRKFGIIGEKIAQDYLRNEDYKILETNFYTRRGEIDIIAKDKDETIVFVEVKTRTSLEFGNPAEAVSYSKIEHILKTAKYYLYVNKIKDTSIRFDVIEVFIYKGRYRVNHIKQIM